MDENKFTLVGEDGKETTYDILLTYESVETNKNYIVYTDGSLDEEGNVQVFASIYDPNNKEAGLIPIETEQEWKLVETILNTLQEEVKNKSNQNNNIEETKAKEETIKNNEQ